MATTTSSKITTDMNGSTPPPSADYAAIAMQGRDKLVFLQFPDEIPTQAEPAIRKAWPEGVKSQKYVGSESYEYCLVGKPFGAMGDKNGVASRILMRDVLAYLYERGWLLSSSMSSSRSLQAKDLLVFRKRPGLGAASATVFAKTGGSSSDGGGGGALSSSVAAAADDAALPPVDWMAVGLSKGGNLRLIGGDNPGVLVRALRRELEKIDAFEGGEWNAAMGVDGGFEIKLKNKPWLAWRGAALVKSQLLLLRVIEVLDGFGWRSYAAICQRTGNDTFKKADTLYFVRAKDFVVGSPFNSEPLSSTLDLDS